MKRNSTTFRHRATSRSGHQARPRRSTTPVGQSLRDEAMGRIKRGCPGGSSITRPPRETERSPTEMRSHPQDRRTERLFLGIRGIRIGYLRLRAWSCAPHAVAVRPVRTHEHSPTPAFRQPRRCRPQRYRMKSSDEPTPHDRRCPRPRARDQVHIVGSIAVRLARIPLAEVREILPIEQLSKLIDERRCHRGVREDVDRTCLHATWSGVIAAICPATRSSASSNS